jgi:hypothetical protein
MPTLARMQFKRSGAIGSARFLTLSPACYCRPARRRSQFGLPLSPPNLAAAATNGASIKIVPSTKPDLKLRLLVHRCQR